MLLSSPLTLTFALLFSLLLANSTYGKIPEYAYTENENEYELEYGLDYDSSPAFKPGIEETDPPGNDEPRGMATNDSWQRLPNNRSFTGTNFERLLDDRSDHENATNSGGVQETATTHAHTGTMLPSTHEGQDLHPSKANTVRQSNDVSQPSGKLQPMPHLRSPQLPTITPALQLEGERQKLENQSHIGTVEKEASERSRLRPTHSFNRDDRTMDSNTGKGHHTVTTSQTAAIEPEHQASGHTWHSVAERPHETGILLRTNLSTTDEEPIATVEAEALQFSRNRPRIKTDDIQRALNAIKRQYPHGAQRATNRANNITPNVLNNNNGHIREARPQPLLGKILSGVTHVIKATKAAGTALAGLSSTDTGKVSKRPHQQLLVEQLKAIKTSDTRTSKAKVPHTKEKSIATKPSQEAIKGPDHRKSWKEIKVNGNTTSHLPRQSFSDFIDSKSHQRVQRSSSPPTFTNSRSVDYRIASHNMEALQDTDETVITNNFLFIAEKTTYVNADYISITRRINFTNLDHLLTQIAYIAQEHGKSCTHLNGYTIDTEAQWVKILTRQMNERDAFRACMDEGYFLPEVHNLEDKQTLEAFMKKHGVERVFAGVEYNSQRDDVVFNSNQETAIIPHMPICANNVVKDWRSPVYKAEWINQPWTYLLHQGTLTLCPHTDSFKEFPVCYKRASSVNHNNSITDGEICKHRQQDIETTLVEVDYAIKRLKESVDPTKPYTHTNEARPRLKREVVALIAIVGALIGLAASCTALAAVAQERPNYDQPIEDLSLNTKTVATAFDDLQADLKVYLNQQQTYDLKVREEDVLYSAFLRIVMTLQDNIIIFQNMITALQYDMVTPDLLSQSEVEEMADDIRRKDQVEIDPSLSNYHVQPVIVNGTLAIEINIPVLEQHKQATLFTVHPYPTFNDNRTKVTPDCSVEHIAVYRHSSDYTVPTDMEAEQCIDKRGTCTINSPRLLSTIDNCAAKEFFGYSVVASIKSTDNSAFFLNVNNTIYYSVPNPTVGFLYCFGNKAGPDNKMELVGKGQFKIPPGCRFESHQYGAKFDPPKELHISHRLQQLKIGLHIGEADPTHGKQVRVDIDKFMVHNITDRLIEISKPKHTSMWYTYLMPIGTILVTVFVLICCCSCGLRYRKGIQTLLRLRRRKRDRYDPQSAEIRFIPTRDEETHFIRPQPPPRPHHDQSVRPKTTTRRRQKAIRSTGRPTTKSNCSTREEEDSCISTATQIRLTKQPCQHGHP